MRGKDLVSGVDWFNGSEVGTALLLSPLVGFVAAALVLTVVRVVIADAVLHSEPRGNAPPPWWNHGILISTPSACSRLE